eukprot:2857723-Prymnesium_polylepis.1
MHTPRAAFGFDVAHSRARRSSGLDLTSRARSLLVRSHAVRRSPGFDLTHLVVCAQSSRFDLTHIVVCAQCVW